tara:strand:+ start:11430 stop:11570 length:141 start_codon:yes stop_codon:yes gene_type:complete
MRVELEVSELLTVLELLKLKETGKEILTQRIWFKDGDGNALMFSMS